MWWRWRGRWGLQNPLPPSHAPLPHHTCPDWSLAKVHWTLQYLIQLIIINSHVTLRARHGRTLLSPFWHVSCDGNWPDGWQSEPTTVWAVIRKRERERERGPHLVPLFYSAPHPTQPTKQWINANRVNLAGPPGSRISRPWEMFCHRLLGSVVIIIIMRRPGHQSSVKPHTVSKLEQLHLFLWDFRELLHL